MNPNLTLLQPYPFEKLAQLKVGCHPPTDLKAINLSLGEPQHPTPELILSALHAAFPTLNRYPTTKGSESLLNSITYWLQQRFQLPAGSIDAQQQILPVNGTREALFSFAQAVINVKKNNPLVVMPNPFYQIYEGAALLAGAQPYYLPCLEENGFQPDFSQVPLKVWQDCQLLYLCSPNNPTGAVLEQATLEMLIRYAEEYDFIIAADECYSELYLNEQSPSVGLLQACAHLKRWDFKRCIVFHSLSKRSNAPGLRSGFVAGDAEIIRQFLHYRTYHGCAMSPAVQAASTAAWRDESHVVANRQLYREKYAAVLEILKPVLSLTLPAAGFYLWPQTPIADDKFAQRLFNRYHVTVLPGRYLSRPTNDGDPGQQRCRIALVAPLADCIEAAQRIRYFLETGL